MRHRALRRLRAALLLGVLALAGYLGALHVLGNFHTVLAGELYRSAQPGPRDIDRAAAMGVRTVLNLRGAHPGSAWYDEELAAARRDGITLLDFPMSARAPLDQAGAERLIALMTSAEKPLLIHCLAGADRTGLASALYLAATGRGEARAEMQMTPIYGHVPLPILPEYAMDDSFEALEPWLGFPNS